MAEFIEYVVNYEMDKIAATIVTFIFMLVITYTDEIMEFGNVLRRNKGAEHDN